MSGGTREVAESCVDSLNMELVATYCKRLHPTKPDLAGRRIEAIGYQVGLQLAERYFFSSHSCLTSMYVSLVYVLLIRGHGSKTHIRVLGFL